MGESVGRVPEDAVDAGTDAPRAPAVFEPLKLLKDGKVIRGKDGWLFLANDVNRVLDQHSGVCRLSDGQLDEWQRLLAARAAYVERAGGHYLMLVAPDTHAIYPEKLPDEIVPAPERPIHQLLERLEKTGRERFIYPLDELKAARAHQEVCSPSDTHWNQFGALVVYERLLDEVERLVPVRRLPMEEVASFELETVGDLSYKLPTSSHATRTFVVVRAGSARLVHDNQVRGTGALVVTECPDAPQTTCLLLGDSYSYNLLKFLAESFRRVVFVYSPTLDRALVEREQPDLVLSLMAERYLIVVPDDLGAPSFSEQERAKREEDQSRKKVPFWSGDHQSLWAVERIRAYLESEGRVMDATIVSVLAYAGLTPDELQRLRWDDIGEREIHVRAPDQGSLGPRPERRVRLLEPLPEDLAAWRRAGRNDDDAVFPGPGGGPWQKGEWRAWDSEVFQPAATACGLEDTRPYDLHDTFCSLLIYEGLSSEEVGRQAGYPPETMLEVYRYRFWVARRSAAVSAERRIRLVRADVSTPGGLPPAEPPSRLK